MRRCVRAMMPSRWSDDEVMHGAMAFYHACQKQGIKGIYGMEVHCVLSPGEQAVFVVLARNDEGFLQLMKLSTRLQTQKEELTIEELAAYAADLHRDHLGRGGCAVCAARARR